VTIVKQLYKFGVPHSPRVKQNIVMGQMENCYN